MYQTETVGHIVGHVKQAENTFHLMHNCQQSVFAALCDLALYKCTNDNNNTHSSFVGNMY